MALFSDGPINGAVDLQNYESSILNVASTEGIDLGAKVKLAQEDIANQLTLFLLQRSSIQGYQGPVWRRLTVNDVVVTAPLRQWHAHKTLAMIYRDAYNSQLNDRYQGLLTAYEQLAKTSRETYLRIGVGVVADPIVKPAPPMLSRIAGPGAAATYCLSVTWVNQSGQESAASDVSLISTSDGEQLVVQPTGAPINALGWNLYVGTAPDALGRQNDGPLGINESWTSSVGIRQGNRPSGGQQPTWYFVDNRVMDRG